VQARSFTWDFENRLTQASNPGVGTTTFRYDPFGRRIQKSGPLGTTNYLYDGANLVHELDGAGNILARYTGTWGLDEQLAQIRSATTSYYEQDALNSVTSMSNSAGVLSNTYVYDAYGKVTASNGALVNTLQLTGREFDAETGLYEYRARYFDPTAGRFLNEDPMAQGENYDGLDLYVYVENNPLNFIDPWGLYTMKHGGLHPPLPPSAQIDALLRCIESKTGLSLTVTSTSEDIPEHPIGTPHRRGVAVDVKYQPGTADKILCAAAGCGAGFGLDEAAHPSKHSTGPHMHVQIPKGKRGGRGDLPQGSCCGSSSPSATTQSSNSSPSIWGSIWEWLLSTF